DSNSPYKSSHFLVPAHQIANNVKYFPSEWINKCGNHIKEEAFSYFEPLVYGDPTLKTENNLPKFKTFNNRLHN
ncbi:MAG: 6-phosphofructokinase, partial [Clostridium sp.]